MLWALEKNAEIYSKFLIRFRAVKEVTVPESEREEIEWAKENDWEKRERVSERERVREKRASERKRTSEREERAPEKERRVWLSVRENTS